MLPVEVLGRIATIRQRVHDAAVALSEGGASPSLRDVAERAGLPVKIVARCRDHLAALGHWPGAEAGGCGAAGGPDGIGPRRREVLEIAREMAESGTLPTAGPIAARLGVTRAAASFHVAALRSAGLWPWRKGRGPGPGGWRMTPRRQQIVDAAAAIAAEGGRVTRPAIMARTGLPQQTVHFAVRALESRGLLPAPVVRIAARGDDGLTDCEREVIEGARSIGAETRPVAASEIAAAIGKDVRAVQILRWKLRQRGAYPFRVPLQGKNAHRQPSAV